MECCVMEKSNNKEIPIESSSLNSTETASSRDNTFEESFEIKGKKMYLVSQKLLPNYTMQEAESTTKDSKTTNEKSKLSRKKTRKLSDIFGCKKALKTKMVENECEEGSSLQNQCQKRIISNTFKRSRGGLSERDSQANLVDLINQRSNWNPKLNKPKISSSYSFENSIIDTLDGVTRKDLIKERLNRDNHNNNRFTGSFSLNSKKAASDFICNRKKEEIDTSTSNEKNNTKEQKLKQRSEILSDKYIRKRSIYFDDESYHEKRKSKIYGAVKTGFKKIGRKLQKAQSDMTWDKYHNLDVIKNYMEQVQSRYPQLVKLKVIGVTCERRSIRALKISETTSVNDTIVIEAGIHAREWLTPATATYITNYLLTKWNLLPKHLKNKTWIIMPVTNPDGYRYTWTTGQRLWRKNRKKRPGNQCYGIDLNRNFDVGWDQSRHTDPCHLNFKGPNPFSEKESQAIRDFLMPIKDQIKAYIALHTYGQEIRFQWGLKEDIQDINRVLKVAQMGAKKMSQVNKELYTVGTINNFVNKAIFGNSRDWARKRLGVKYAYLIELRDRGHYGFLLPPNQIIPTAEEALEFIATVALAIDEDQEKEKLAALEPSKSTFFRNNFSKTK